MALVARPWQADVFAGQLSQELPPARAKLLGARVQIMPLPGLELGASRTIQWGGSGRPESLGSLWDAIVGDDNVDSPSGAGTDPGNQLAGFDARWQLRFGRDSAYRSTPRRSRRRGGGLRAIAC